jgi:hypothetical protein
LKSLQPIASVQDSKVGKADLVWVAGDDFRQAKEFGVDLLFGNVELVVATVVCLRPLQLPVVSDQVFTDVVGAGNGDVLTKRTGAADCSASEFNADCTSASRGIVRTLVKPDKI